MDATVKLKNVKMTNGVSVKTSETFWQANRFALVGAAATAVHLLVVKIYFSLVQTGALTPVKYDEYMANSLAFMVAFSISYFGHRYFTFKQAGSIIRLFLVALTGFLINNIVLTGLLNFSAISGWLAVTISTLTVPIITFILAKAWVFKT